MTTTPEYIDAIGQKITPGDFVISVRDGTGARPRMAIKFSPAKVSVSDWGNNQTYMDACSLVVITPNLIAMKDAGDANAEKCMNDLKSIFQGMIVHDAPKAKPVPLRWLVVAYNKDGNSYGKAPIEFVSMHEVRGMTDDVYQAANTEAMTLGSYSDMKITATCVRKEPPLYYQNTYGKHWDWSGVSAKDALFPLKSLIEIGIENLELNKLIPVDTFNSMVPPTHRIKQV